jgi:hypothetical protein
LPTIEKDVEITLTALKYIYSDIKSQVALAEHVSIPISQMRSKTKFGTNKLIKTLLKAEHIRLIEMVQRVKVEHTKQRTAEVYFLKENYNFDPLCLKIIFDFAEDLLSQVKPNDSKHFSESYLQYSINNVLSNVFTQANKAFIKSENESKLEKNDVNYWEDINKKRIKHVFTILRLLKKVKVQSKFPVKGATEVEQYVFNGFANRDEWKRSLGRLYDDCCKLLKFIAQNNIQGNKKTFYWKDLLGTISQPDNLQYLADVIYALSVLGYIKSSGLLPSGIEVYISSTDPIDENNEEIVIGNQSDKDVFDEYINVQQIQELKLIALQALSSVAANQQKDSLIKGFFACSSVQDLINLLQNYLEPKEADKIFKAFRGEAIKEKEDELNQEQKLVYDAPVDKHINVTAGPGSGKTHTLSLRVARLVHHVGIAPEEILVLAYNRAVVSELKDRLKKLFVNLGYANLSKRINIYTFHELALRTCRVRIENNGNNLPFEQWETTLRSELSDNPGLVMNRLGNIKHILIDEFQDIDDTRIEILDLLTKQLPNMKLFIIGDPNQSIYGYARNNIDPYFYYDAFNAKFSPLLFNLVSNYRSYPKVLESASLLLLNRQTARDLKVWVLACSRF